MTEQDLLNGINSQQAAEIFSELYGENEIDIQRKRYTSLILKMRCGEFPKEELENTCGGLRVFSSPGRTELAGNHTDHNRGKVLAASIQLDCAAIVQKRNDNIVFFRSTGFPDVKVKLTNKNGEPDLKPKPEETGTTEALVRGIAAEFQRRGIAAGGFSANAASAVLPGSGLSSSAAAEVLFGCIFDSLYNEGKLAAKASGALEIAQIGQTAENVYFGKPCGLMDQTACAAGGAVAINFADTLNPVVKQINLDLAAAGYTLCVVNTGGSHADLTSDYASIPVEMKAVASFFGKSALRDIDKETVLNSAHEIRMKYGDRALLRALHFFNENERVDAMSAALTEMDKAKSSAEKQKALYQYLELINESGNSSWELLQNVYSPNSPKNQGITTALALTENFIKKEKLNGAHRVHGGGFAGTIQAYIPIEAMENYRTYIETIFGTDSVTPLRIRPKGAVEFFL
ncbi:MAG: galactokinase [Treponema sp.]|jgi:galactokinase|nr:galactokinase [Treponema sp.]